MTGPHPLKLAFAREYPGELAAYLAAQGHEATVQALSDLPAAAAAALVAHLPRTHAMRVLSGYDDEVIAGWLDEAGLDDALALALNIEETRRAKVFERMSKRRTRDTLRRLLVYPQTTVGALADPAALQLETTMPLGEAVTILREASTGSEHTVWLVDGDGKYAGLLDSSSALVANNDNKRLGDMALKVKPLLADTTLINAREVVEWQRHPELPVVDHLDHLLGTLTRERLMAALGGETASNGGLIADMGDLTRQYFHVLGNALGDLLGPRGPGR